MLDRGRPAVRAGGRARSGSRPARQPAAARTALARARRDAARPEPAALGPARRATRAADRRRPRRVPAARPGHQVRPATGAGSTGCGRCSAPGTSSSRAPRACQFDPMGRREPISGTLRTAARSGSTAIADDGLRRRLPAAHPPDRHHVNRKGPQQHPRAAARATPARPWAIGARRGRARRHPPDLGTFADFDAFVARARRTRPGGGARPGAAGVARPPLGERASGVVHHAGRRRRSPTRRTRRRSTRTSIRSTSTTTPRASTPRSLRIVRLWMEPRRADLPGRQPAHQAARRSGSG